MLRNQNNNSHDMYREMGLNPPIQEGSPSPFKLDSKDERLLELSQEVGRVYGQNDLLNEDNQRLERENAELKRNNATLEGRNRTLEKEDGETKSAATFAAELKQELDYRLKPQGFHYVVKKDGDKWCAHTSEFTNLQESDEVAFASTPSGALNKLTKLLKEKQ